MIIDTTGGSVFLNATGGNAINSPVIRLGNSSYDGSTSSAMTLLQSNQINDTSVIRFDGGSGRNGFFRLAGFNETVQGITDSTSQGVIENTSGTGSTLTVSTGANNYAYNGFIRNNGSGVLSLVKNGTGRLNLAGGNDLHRRPHRQRRHGEAHEHPRQFVGAERVWNGHHQQRRAGDGSHVELDFQQGGERLGYLDRSSARRTWP